MQQRHDKNHSDPQRARHRRLLAEARNGNLAGAIAESRRLRRRRFFTRVLRESLSSGFSASFA